jgi:hypothetical protein
LLWLLRAFRPFLSNCSVVVRGDALNVFSIPSKGGSAKEHLQSICLELFAFCSDRRIELRPEWLPREENARADYLSKIRDVDDFGLSAETFAFVSQRFGPFTVDQFASEHNAKLPRFNAFYWCPGAEAANCFTQNWDGVERNYCFPPLTLVAPTLRHARACRARLTLVVLGWRSAPWWPLLSGSVESGRGFAPFVRGQLYFPAGREVLVPGRASRDRFFGKGVPILDVFALDVDFTTQVSLTSLPPLLPLRLIPTNFLADWFNFESWDLAAADLPSTDQELVSLLVTLYDAALLCRAASTFCTYSGPWKHYKEWCQQKGVPALPSSPLTVALYMMRLLRTARTPAPLLTFSGAVYLNHFLAGLPSPTNHPLVCMARKSARRMKIAGLNQKRPFLASQIRRLFELWGSPSANLHQLMKLTAVTLCYVLFLRFDDLVAIQWQSIKFVAQSHMELFLPDSKTDQYHHGATIYVARLGGPFLPS